MKVTNVGATFRYWVPLIVIPNSPCKYERNALYYREIKVDKQVINDSHVHLVFSPVPSHTQLSA